jgi:DNA-binding transcriptional LysR family regulator
MRRLEIFCRVIELGSFTKAAALLSVSQPTVSEHMRVLEETVGERLIDRFGREIRATTAGQLFYRYAKEIVRMRDEAINALEQFKGNLAGRLILGASTIPGTYMLPKFVGAFKFAHPSIQITLRIADTLQIVDMVRESDLEIGLVGSQVNDKRVVMEEIFSDELVLVVYPGHRWARRRKVKVTELSGEPFILRERGSGTRMVMSRILQEHGADPEGLAEVAEMGSTEAVRQGIKSRIGISILSLQAVAEDIELGRLLRVNIDGVRFLRPLYLVQRKHRHASPLCQAFIDYLHGAADTQHQQG